MVGGHIIRLPQLRDIHGIGRLHCKYCYVNVFFFLLSSRETKIVLKGENEDALSTMAANADSLGLANYLVQDAGKTQVNNLIYFMSVCQFFNPIFPGGPNLPGGARISKS